MSVCPWERAVGSAPSPLGQLQQGVEELPPWSQEIWAIVPALPLTPGTQPWADRVVSVSLRLLICGMDIVTGPTHLAVTSVQALSFKADAWPAANTKKPSSS